MEYSGNLDLEEGELPDDVAGATGEPDFLRPNALIDSNNADSLMKSVMHMAIWCVETLGFEVSSTATPC